MFGVGIKCLPYGAWTQDWTPAHPGQSAQPPWLDTIMLGYIRNQVNTPVNVSFRFSSTQTDNSPYF